MDDLERLSQALVQLEVAISTKKTPLGVNQDEYWMRQGAIVVEKLKHRTERLIEDRGVDFAFLMPLLISLGRYDLAKIVFEKRFFVEGNASLENDLDAVRKYLTDMKPSGISRHLLMEKVESFFLKKHPGQKSSLKDLE